MLLRFTKLLSLGIACTLSITPAAAQSMPSTATPVGEPGAIIPATAAQTSPPALPSSPSKASLSKAVEFASVATATAHCPDGEVVWSSLNKSHSFHTSSSRYFGKTKHGAYVCKSDALAAGFHQAKS